MTEPGHHDHDGSSSGSHMDWDISTPDQSSAQPNLLVADELPMSEDDYALAIQSSKALLQQQINHRRHTSHHKRQYPRQRPQNTSRSVDKLVQGLNRQHLKQADDSSQRSKLQSPLRSCINSRCTSATITPRPSSTRLWELDHGRRVEEATEGRTSRAESDQALSANSELRLETSKSESPSASMQHTQSGTMLADNTMDAGNEMKPSSKSIPQTLIAADPDDYTDTDEGFFDGTDDLLRLGEDTNEMMDALGAYRRRGLLRFRRSTEAAATCPVVVRSIPRMRRRKQKKMEVRLRAATIPDGSAPGRPANPTTV